MPPGGLAELKRRKQEAERAASGGGEAPDSNTSAAAAAEPEPAAEQKPGELQHVSRRGSRSCSFLLSVSFVVPDIYIRSILKYIYMGDLLPSRSLCLNIYSPFLVLQCSSKISL